MSSLCWEEVLQRQTDRREAGRRDGVCDGESFFLFARDSGITGNAAGDFGLNLNVSERPMQILIVEDNELSARAMEMVLNREGHETMRARNGLEALQKLQVDQGIDLMITDIMMPQMDGLSLLHALRETTDYVSLPVILCTAVSDMHRVKEAADLGCRHYLVKPVQPDELLRRIEQVLEGGCSSTA